MSDETKIVVIHKEGAATVGIQRTNCDPAFFNVQGDLAAAINAVPGFVEEAGTRWQTNQRYPKADLPAPPPPPPAAAQAQHTSTTTRTSLQQNML